MTVTLLEWKNEYLIGVEELDYEHKDLFTRLNQLHGILLQNDDKDIVEACLGEIHTRLMAHFALEEHYMREQKSPGYEQHKKEHDNFLDVIVDSMEKFRFDPELSYGETLEVQLQQWIVGHITTSDRHMDGNR